MLCCLPCGAMQMRPLWLGRSCSKAMCLKAQSLTSGIIKREWNLGTWVLLEGAKGLEEVPLKKTVGCPGSALFAFQLL